MSKLSRLSRSTYAAAALAAGLPAVAVELQLVGAETSFYCYASPAGRGAPPAGLACEIMAEMARRVGHRAPIQLYPLARALMVAQATPGVLVAPVARIPTRETQYQWQVPLLEEEFVVVARHDSTLDISSPEAVRKLSLGVVRDGAGERLARELGFERVSLVTHDDLNARKLHAGRIDAWLSSWNGVLSAQRNVGLGAGLLRRGAVLSRTQIYLASAPGLDPALLAGWRAALDAMKRDGSYQQLLRKYQFELPQ